MGQHSVVELGVIGIVFITVFGWKQSEPENPGQVYRTTPEATKIAPGSHGMALSLGALELVVQVTTSAVEANESVTEMR